jgi:hypothetical protein
MNQTLDEYLRKLDRDALIAEACRQSLAANSTEEREHDAFWGNSSDTCGWR